MSLYWITPPGFIFTATQAGSVDVSVQAAGNNVEYSLISGELPLGLSVSNTGTISGFTDSVIFPTTSTFVIRAVDGDEIKDRTFKIYQEPLGGPVWNPNGFNIDGDKLSALLINDEYFDRILEADITDNDYKVTYRISSGKLPHGLRFDTSGRIYGNPKLRLEPGYVRKFYFTITASNGYLESSQDFVFKILDTDSFTVDSTALVIETGTQTTSIIDLTLEGTASLGVLQLPEFLNNSNLGLFYSDDNHYIPVTAFDPNPKLGPVLYSAIDSLPPDLVLDSKIGYIYGNVPANTSFLRDYSFRIAATKFNSNSGESVTATNTFTLGILGNNRDSIVWNTDTDLGNITEGITSELSLSASSTSVFDLEYQLYPENIMPAGLELNPSGNIVGAATTSGSFNFTVIASTSTYTGSMLQGPVYPHPFSTQTFSLNILPISEEYTSIYVAPLMTVSKRNKWETFINDDTIFLSSLLYRADDPAFGVQKDIKMYLEFGIEKVNLSDYATALNNHFYKRQLTFGPVKTATANDSKGNIVYDVVYVDIIDEIDGAKTAVEINGIIYYPGSIGNMRETLESIILPDSSTIKTDPKHLPRFMQAAGGNNYMKVVVLAYTLPGQAKKIAAKIRASKFDFQSLDFTIDRLIVQNSLDNTGTAYLIFGKNSITEN